MTDHHRRTIELAPPGRSLAEHADLTRLAAASGWKGAWLSEVNGFDAVTQAAVVAANVGEGRVGTAIVPMQTRDPLLMAMTATALNQLTGGRFVLGLGTSTRVIVEDWHATDWGAPITLTREYVSLLRRFLAGERVTTDGGRYRYRNASLSSRLAAPVPIYLAALNNRMLELAGEVADGVILNFASVEYVARARARLAAGAARAGRSLDDFEIVVYFRSSLTDDHGAVRDRYQRELLTYVLAPVYQKMFARDGFGPMCSEVERLWKAGDREAALAAIPDGFVRDRALVGTADELAASLDRYFEAGMDAAIVLPVPAPERDYIGECENVVTSLGKAMSRETVAGGLRR